MDIPNIHVLVYHDAVNTDVPHLSRTVPAGFQPVINLLSFIGSLDGGTLFINEVPFLNLLAFWRQGIILTIGVKRSSVFGGRSRHASSSCRRNKPGCPRRKSKY